MKKFKYLIVSIISIFLFNISAFAASGNLSVSSSSVYVGDSFTVTVNLYSMAAWVVKVTPSGPVSGCSINEVNDSGTGENVNKSISATCTATGTGTITLRLSGDITDSDYNTVYLSASKNVTVTQKPTPAPDSGSVTPSSGGNSSSNNNNSSINNPTTDDRSSNNNIKDLSVEGYELTQVDNNNYTLTVPYDVDSINVGGSTEDAKANINGIGKHNLNIGENNIEVVVTAENGSQNKINIKVTRKDNYYIEDLDRALKNDKSKEVNIKVKSDTKISESNLKNIKDSKKTVYFDYYDENNTLLYSWIVDGSKLKDTNELDTSIKFDSKNKKEILVLSNYADGIFISTNVKNNLKATKLKVFVGNKYSNGDLVNIYSYKTNSGKLEIVDKKIKVKDGFIEFEVNDDSDYFVTMSNINNNDEKICISKSMWWVPVVIGVLLLLLIIFFIIKKKKKKDITSDDEII